MIERLILVRHGETVHNVAGIAQGWNDSALSDHGLRQVNALARRVATMHPDALFSSPLGRALSTAQAIADETGLTVQPLEELREMNYGGWEGRSFLDVHRDDADVYLRWIGDPDEPCPGGESHNDVFRRMQAAFGIVGERAKRPIVVTHGTAIRIGVTALIETPVMTSRHFAQDNAALNLFIRRGERWVMKQWNDTTHCPNAER